MLAVGKDRIKCFSTLCILQWLQAPPEAKLMGEQLLSNGQARFTKAAAVGAQATLGDWKVSPEVQTGSLAAGVAEIALELPTSSAAVLVQVPDRQTDTTVTVPFLDEDKLEVFCLSAVGAFLSETLLCRSVKPQPASACRKGFLSHVSSALQQSSKVVCSKSMKMSLLLFLSLPLFPPLSPPDSNMVSVSGSQRGKRTTVLEKHWVCSLQAFVGIGTNSMWTLASRKARQMRQSPSPFVDPLAPASSYADSQSG